MPKLNEEDLMKNLDFKCARCQAECTKINAAEPELGYISKLDGKIVGPLCQKCFSEIPDEEKRVTQMPETAFLVVIKADGEGAVMTTADNNFLYLRDPTFNDIIAGCNQVSRDVQDAIFAQKLTANLARLINPSQKSKLVVPR